MHAVPYLRRLPLLAASALLALTAGCAQQPPASDPDAVADYQQTNDPLEPTNRFFYKVDDALDNAVLKPVAQGYVAVVPVVVRTGLHNVLQNLSAPVLFVNDVAQLKPHRASVTVWRFVVNSTAGVGGVFDVAKSLGAPAHESDFGVTLGVWGVPDGPFLYLPLFGPSSPRALVGEGVDTVANPFFWVPNGHGFATLDYARGGLGILDLRASLLGDLDHVKASALDPYATFRSLYRQHVQSEVEASQAAN